MSKKLTYAKVFDFIPRLQDTEQKDLEAVLFQAYVSEIVSLLASDYDVDIKSFHYDTLDMLEPRDWVAILIANPQRAKDCGEYGAFTTTDWLDLLYGGDFDTFIDRFIRFKGYDDASASTTPKYTIEQRLHAIYEECSHVEEMLVRKALAYGNSVSAPMNVFSKSANAVSAINVRLDDKLSRIAHGVGDNEDTELDIIGYLILKRIIAKEQ